MEALEKEEEAGSASAAVDRAAVGRAREGGEEQESSTGEAAGFEGEPEARAEWRKDFSGMLLGRGTALDGGEVVALVAGEVEEEGGDCDCFG